MVAGGNDLLLDALRLLAAAIRDEREARVSGEYSDGYVRDAEDAIERLAAQLGRSQGGSDG